MHAWCLDPARPPAESDPRRIGSAGVSSVLCIHQNLPKPLIQLITDQNHMQIFLDENIMSTDTPVHSTMSQCTLRELLARRVYLGSSV
jgi:hypothetical protein